MNAMIKVDRQSADSLQRNQLIDLRNRAYLKLLTKLPFRNHGTYLNTLILLTSSIENQNSEFPSIS